jgi:hypothetical protein
MVVERDVLRDGYPRQQSLADDLAGGAPTQMSVTRRHKDGESATITAGSWRAQTTSAAEPRRQATGPGRLWCSAGRTRRRLV